MDSAGQHIVIGTAGHIDHGKSALIKALTGTDPDRLPEEKERGMTIDLGFAFWGEHITFIDVPGHEKFIKNMLAGATTIDFIILVIAADDGIMPQTIEHFEIAKLLNIKKGLTVINKIDMVEGDWVDLVTNDVRKFLEGSFLADAPIVPVSSLTGDGIERLKQELGKLLEEVKPKVDRGIFRLPIDRIFSMKGFGTIVAGTVLSGRAHVGDQLELLPHRKDVRIRGIQVHNRSVDTAKLGERAAFNLLGIEKEIINRGDVIAQPGYFKPTSIMNGSLSMLKDFEGPLKHMTRVRLHVGTSEIMCRVFLIDRKDLHADEAGLVQFKMERPAVCDRTDRFVIRFYSPQKTIGGGVVLEPNPGRAVRYDRQLIERLNALTTERPEDIVSEVIRSSRAAPLSPERISHLAGIELAKIGPIIDRLQSEKNVIALDFEARTSYYNSANFADYQAAIIKSVEKILKDNPLKVEVKHSELKALFPKELKLELFNMLLKTLAAQDKLKFEGGTAITLPGFQVALSEADKALCDRIEQLYLVNKFAPPSLEETIQAVKGNEAKVKELFAFLINSGKLVNAGEDVVFHRRAIEEAEQVARKHFASNPEMRAGDFKEKLGTTRKYAIPLLGYFDMKGVTLRRADIRILKDKK